MLGFNFLNRLNKRCSVLLILIMLFSSCKEEGVENAYQQRLKPDFISAVDISNYSEIANSKPTFYNLEGNPQDFLSILKENGINTIRLRLWVDSLGKQSRFNAVKELSKVLTNKGFKIWLTLHYSDTWADPGLQQTPPQWQGLDLESLGDSIYNYTTRVVHELRPNYIQIGNEINSGILHPYGIISPSNNNFIHLLQKGCSAVRNNSQECKIIVHFAGLENADVFYSQLNILDYDMIGLSYYPIWHGKSLHTLENTLENLSASHAKQIVIAETAYPFTLEWNDWTNNIVGLDDQLILPDYPATVEGQSDFIKEIKRITYESDKGIGFCYWGAELIAWKGEQGTDASPWENQALFDFSNKALPVLKQFKL